MSRTVIHASITTAQSAKQLLTNRSGGALVEIGGPVVVMCVKTCGMTVARLYKVKEKTREGVHSERKREKGHETKERQEEN